VDGIRTLRREDAGQELDRPVGAGQHGKSRIGAPDIAEQNGKSEHQNPFAFRLTKAMVLP
jgi:hypothetical protein